MFGACGVALSDRGGPFVDLTQAFVKALGSPSTALGVFVEVVVSFGPETSFNVSVVRSLVIARAVCTNIDCSASSCSTISSSVVGMLVTVVGMLCGGAYAMPAARGVGLMNAPMIHRKGKKNPIQNIQ